MSIRKSGAEYAEDTDETARYPTRSRRQYIGDDPTEHEADDSPPERAGFEEGAREPRRIDQRSSYGLLSSLTPKLCCKRVQ